MKINSDWHMHSNNSCDEACAKIADIVREADELGIENFGITDHLHVPHNLPDLVASRKEFLVCNASSNFHFGVEASCVSRWEIDELAKGNYTGDPTYGIREGGPPEGPLAIGITERDIVALGIEYIVGGTHWPIYVPIERMPVIKNYHQQNMFFATHPWVDIVAHPWWWMMHWADADGKHLAEPWFDDFKVIPQSMHDEFAAAAMEYGKLVEINLCAMLFNWRFSDRFKQQYLEYFAALKAKGVKLSIGSDLHAAHYHEIDFASAETMLDRVGITEADLHAPDFSRDILKRRSRTSS